MENDLQFERADFTAPVAAKCSACQQPLLGAYFSANGQVLCARCAESLRAQLGGVGSSAGRFAQAAAFGAGAAVLGGAVYGAVMAYLHAELALISIGVGIGVGKAVRKGSGQRGGWRYQLLAAALTYASVCGAYGFFYYHGLTDPTADDISGLIFAAYRLPFLRGFENVIGILIIGFGVYQAWQMNRGIALEIAGPHPLAPGAPATPPAGA